MKHDRIPSTQANLHGEPNLSIRLLPTYVRTMGMCRAYIFNQPSTLGSSFVRALCREAISKKEQDLDPIMSMEICFMVPRNAVIYGIESM